MNSLITVIADTGSDNDKLICSCLRTDSIDPKFACPLSGCSTYDTRSNIVRHIRKTHNASEQDIVFCVPQVNTQGVKSVLVHDAFYPAGQTTCIPMPDARVRRQGKRANQPSVMERQGKRANQPHASEPKQPHASEPKQPSAFDQRKELMLAALGAGHKFDLDKMLILPGASV